MMIFVLQHFEWIE